MTNASGMPRVAFQGERGAFSEEAAIALLGEQIDLVPRPTFEAAFAAIQEGLADRILAPIENSLAGSVHRSYDLLVESKLSIIGEVVISIVMNLIGVPGAALEQITTVESHPVALAQCEQFFSANPKLKRIAVEDTAGSVRAIMDAGDPSRAAIAGRRAADVYGGKVLREHLEDHRENYTRFLLLTAEAPEVAKEAGKLSLVIQLSHQPGALYHALGAFSRRNINMLKIESRPVLGHPWQYRFYLDLQASTNDPEVMDALGELESLTGNVRILGCYPAAIPQARKSQTQQRG